MLLSSKFLTESTGKKIAQISQYLAKIWTKCNSLLFGPPCTQMTAATSLNTMLRMIDVKTMPSVEY